jgi:hypothetical protein
MRTLDIPVKSLALLLVASFFLFGCTGVASTAGQDNSNLPVETLWAGSQSSHTTAQSLALYVSDPVRLNALIRANPNRAAMPILEHRRVDWRREAVVWLFMGRRNSGGYALSLASPVAIVSHGVAVIKVQWREPRPGAMVTQQLTSPCLVLILSKGNYEKIEIQDETGGVRTRLVLSDATSHLK